MVDQSELPFRMLCRAHGAEAAYTPMLHSRLFLEQQKYRDEHFSTCPGDRPLFIQFCANDPDTFVAAAQIVQEHADYIDLNLGCPQRIAKRGFYGAFLMDDVQLIEQLVLAAATRLDKPVSCKIRLFPDIGRTIEYARMLQAAGCSLLAVHGRLRECKDNSAVRADWDGIAAVRAAVQIPVLANGDVQCMADAQRLVAHTKADGVMSAEPLLSDPALFSSARQPQATITHLESFQLCKEYLDLVAEHPSHARMVKGHVHKLLRGWLSEFTDIRERIQRDASGGDLTALRSLVAELGSSIAATGRDHPIPKLTERKLKQMEKEAAKQASIQEQEREAAGLAAVGATAAAGAHPQLGQQQQQQQQQAAEPQQQLQQQEQTMQPAAAVDVISSSKLETCIRNGTQGANSSAISCKQKLVVVVSVDSGDSISSQDLQFTLNCVGSSTGQCPCPCNYASDASCGCRDLASSLTVSLSKGPLWASYPLTYLQSFNYKPYEAIVRPGAGQCKVSSSSGDVIIGALTAAAAAAAATADGVFDDVPTCGWYYINGQKVDDSQGFVCQCDSGQIWDTTFGANKERTRANLDCDFFSDPLDILIGRKPCSAHCLMMDPHWYGGYALGEASMQFEIAASLAYAGASSGSGSGSSSPETLKLSPSVPWALSAGRTLGAKLLGDLAGYTQLPVLSERVLLIPHPRSGQSVSDVFANRTEWMLLDRSRVSFDGGECDKVGTSFTAFRYQPGACVRAPQVCLTNQLRDILEAERARIASGRAPLYLVSQYTHGLNSSMRTFAGGPLSFALPVSGIRSSLVQLEAEADSMRFVVNTSPGSILGARVCQFAEVTCGGFEASATRGFLHAFLANLGTLPAAYTLTVSNCSLNIRPVEAQRVALAPGQNGTITPFVIYVEDDQAVAARFCWLTMLDSQGGVTDQVRVQFYTNATAYEEWPSGGLIGNGTGPGTQQNKDCANVCNNRFDFVCAIRNNCWGNVGRFFGLTLGLASAAALLFLALKLGWLTSLLPLLSCCCGGSSSSSRKNKQRKYEYDDEYASYGDDSKQKGPHKDKAGSAAPNSSSGGRHTGQQYRTDMDELQAAQEGRRQSSAGRPRGTSRSGRESKAEIYVDDEQQQQPYHEEAAGVGRGSSFYGSSKKKDNGDRYNMYSSGGASSGSPGRWIKAGAWDDSAAGGAGGRVPGGTASGVHAGRRSSSAGGRPRASAGGHFLDEDGYESEEAQNAEMMNLEALTDEGQPVHLGEAAQLEAAVLLLLVVVVADTNTSIITAVVLAGRRQRGSGIQQDDFFAPYEDSSLAGGEEEEDELHLGTEAEGSEGQDELEMSAYRQGREQPQQQQQQHRQQQQPLQRQSRQQSQVDNWPEQQQQQQQSQQGKRASQAATPFRQPAASSPGGSSRASWQQQQQQQQSPQRLSPSPVGGPLSTASRPHLAPHDGRAQSGHAGSGDGRGGASSPGVVASSSRRTTASEAGSGIGRSRQQQQQQQHLGSHNVGSQQQRLSLAIPSPAARVPGFVRSAAAALSGSGGRSPSSVAGTPVGASGSRRSPSSRDSQQQQQLRQMLTSNPLYDGVDG
ncbi:dihydrouridine synthase-domain-containing protein [Scenedesmus sp. NREL 46B-D3]|nr:dihydrouridine synthase-domain-containing protein [Scenedesmus sp. NREL 46B-D3]